MRPLKNPVVKQAAATLQAAMQSGDEKQVTQAWEGFLEAAVLTKTRPWAKSTMSGCLSYEG